MLLMGKGASKGGLESGLILLGLGLVFLLRNLDILPARHFGSLLLIAVGLLVVLGVLLQRRSHP
jgi:hypothetical protein